MQLVIQDINKTYSNGVQALKNVTLTINQGMFGLLAPNGAGKSSLIRIIATLQEADSGSSLNISDIVKRLKGRTSGRLQDEYPELSKGYWGRHFWAIGYGVWSTGNITDEMVQEYLEHHRKPGNIVILTLLFWSKNFILFTTDRLLVESGSV